MRNNYGFEVESFKKITIFKLSYVRSFLEELLHKDHKKRLNLFQLDYYEFYNTRMKSESPEDFIMASKLIFSYKKKNHLLDNLKKIYATKIMTYQQHKKFINVMNVFDLSHKGCLDYLSFTQGIQRASPDTDEKLAKQIFAEIDDNGNKFIEYEEFIIAFLEDEEMMNIQVLKKIFDFIQNDEEFLKSQFQNKSTVQVPIDNIRIKLEMDDPEYDYYYNYLKDKGQTMIN